MREEYGLPGNRPLGSRLEFGPLALIGVRTIAHLGLERDALLNVHHGPSLGDHHLSGIKFDLHKLKVVSMDLVVNFVALHFEVSRR